MHAQCLVGILDATACQATHRPAGRARNKNALHPNVCSQPPHMVSLVERGVTQASALPAGARTLNVKAVLQGKAALPLLLLPGIASVCAQQCTHRSFPTGRPPVRVQSPLTCSRASRARSGGSARAGSGRASGGGWSGASRASDRGGSARSGAGRASGCAPAAPASGCASAGCCATPAPATCGGNHTPL